MHISLLFPPLTSKHKCNQPPATLNIDVIDAACPGTDIDHSDKKQMKDNYKKRISGFKWQPLIKHALASQGNQPVVQPPRKLFEIRASQ